MWCAFTLHNIKNRKQAFVIKVPYTKVDDNEVKPFKFVSCPTVKVKNKINIYIATKSLQNRIMCLYNNL